MPENLYKVLIVGGGTSGWMTAAAMSRFLPAHKYQITLIESDAIGTVGVGEATIPHIRQFNDILGIDENEFIRATNATYKLGISFEDWQRPGKKYIHPFGSFGFDVDGIDFHHYWLKLFKQGLVNTFDDYSMAVVAARNNRFDYPNPNGGSLTSAYAYAFHIDAGLYARYLRTYAEAKGVIRREGIIDNVEKNENTGDIISISTKVGERLDADLFIDCSGFRSLLIEEALKTGFEDWSHWLPCDRAVAIPCEKIDEPIAYTRAIAREAGWQWRIPLQHRTGNGYVYASKYVSDDQALQTLLTNIDGAPISDPNFLKFIAGRRKKSWNYNCVAIGLASGFLEPLESTSIYLIQTGILKLIEFFPDKIINPILRDEFNRLIELEYLRIRDFLILHYCATERRDSAFWDYCRTMSIPDDLQRKINLFKKTAQIERYHQGLFMMPSWLAVYLGQGVIPNAFDTRLEYVNTVDIARLMSSIRVQLDEAAKAMPSASVAISQAIQNSSSSYPAASLSLYGVGS